MPASVSDAGILFFAIPLCMVVDVFPVRKNFFAVLRSHPMIVIRKMHAPVAVSPVAGIRGEVNDSA
ncbi:hypothetical protein [Herbaspirillum lusitanum]|uniref:hypothetical protein n=1 Tax=Herbaspirillum lusitanum TaxID=213312 RepID=UPI0012F4F8C4|nr:hypothetical protein [Herbaspirillum lusitanum]